MAEHFEIHDRVVTPSGETATVVGFDPDKRVKLRYEGTLPGSDGSVTLHPNLLRKCTPGQRPPKPVLIKFKGGA